MDPQAVANALWAFASLGVPPAPATRTALDAAAERLAPRMKPQEVANALFAFAVFDRSPPPAVVDAAVRLPGSDFSANGFCQLFQAHLAELASGRSLDLPAELLARAEDAWRGDVDDTSMSDFHRDVANALDRLGADHVVEGATDDGLFRVDCLLADRRVAVEADGPSHYLADRAPNGPTRLRRRLLEARDLRVVSVPYFEWDPLPTDAAKDAYLGGLLARSRPR